MGSKLFIGNLSFDTTEVSLKGHFERAGFQVDRVTIVNDRETGRPRGFGFVEMDDAAGQQAIEALNGQSMDGRDLKVNEARPREDRPPQPKGGSSTCPPEPLGEDRRPGQLPAAVRRA